MSNVVLSESSVELIHVMIFNLESKLDGLRRDFMDAEVDGNEAGKAAAERDTKAIEAQVNALVELSKAAGVEL